jgi:Uncharacterized protein conserved in bacteria
MAADEKKRLVNRARSIQGHMGAVTRMLEEDAYCIDIIQQTQAIEKALEKVTALVLEPAFESLRDDGDSVSTSPPNANA